MTVLTSGYWSTYRHLSSLECKLYRAKLIMTTMHFIMPVSFLLSLNDNPLEIPPFQNLSEKVVPNFCHHLVQYCPMLKHPPIWIKMYVHTIRKEKCVIRRSNRCFLASVEGFFSSQNIIYFVLRLPYNVYLLLLSNTFPSIFVSIWTGNTHMHVAFLAPFVWKNPTINSCFCHTFCLT